MTGPGLSSARQVIAAALRAWNIEAEDFFGPRRLGALSRARFAVCWVLYQRTLALRAASGSAYAGQSLLTIGRIVQRDHTTVIHAVARAAQLRDECPAYRALTDMLAAPHRYDWHRVPTGPGRIDPLHREELVAGMLAEFAARKAA